MNPDHPTYGQHATPLHARSAWEIESAIEAIIESHERGGLWKDGCDLRLRLLARELAERASKLDRAR